MPSISTLLLSSILACSSCVPQDRTFTLYSSSSDPGSRVEYPYGNWRVTIDGIPHEYLGPVVVVGGCAYGVTYERTYVEIGCGREISVTPLPLPSPAVFDPDSTIPYYEGGIDPWGSEGRDWEHEA